MTVGDRLVYVGSVAVRSDISVANRRDSIEIRGCEFIRTPKRQGSDPFLIFCEVVYRLLVLDFNLDIRVFLQDGPVVVSRPKDIRDRRVYGLKLERLRDPPGARDIRRSVYKLH